MEMKGSTRFQPPWARYPEVCQSCVDPSKQWPNSAVPRTFGHVDGYISWELARVTITQHTVLFERAGGRTACLSVDPECPDCPVTPSINQSQGL